MNKDDFDIRVFAKRLSQLLEQSDENTHTLAKKLSLTPATISRYANALMSPKVPTLYAMAEIFSVNPLWLYGFDVPMQIEENATSSNFFPSPNITKSYFTYPVIGEVAAGYDYPALEDWEGDTVDVPKEYLHGRQRDEFFVLKVKGDSMYPIYHDGDKVLVLKQTTLNYSGQVGVVLYDDELGTLKKVEYKMGEDWIRLVPINPIHQTIKIEGERLEHCRILGIPKLLIRDINE